MAMVACNECNGQVSTTASACPQCGAPFKKFMGPPKSFKDRFSADRMDAAFAEAKQQKRAAGRSLFGAVVGWGMLILIGLAVYSII